MARTRRTVATVEDNLKLGWFMCWQNRTYRIVSRHHVFIEIEDTATPGTITPLRMDELYKPESRNGSPPIFAPTLDKLRAEVGIVYPTPKPTAGTTLPQWAIHKAETVIAKVKQVEREMDNVQRNVLREGNILARTELVNAACCNVKIGRSTYYKYDDLMRRYYGKRDAIAASFLHANRDHTRFTDSQIHFVDSAIVHYYKRTPAITKGSLYNFMESDHTRNNEKWIDLSKCGANIPQDLILELFDSKLSIEAIEANPEKRRLLAPIELPSRAWLYTYVNNWERRPDEGKALIVERYGEDAWEHEQMIFDTFVSMATRPLQFVFADHYRLKVFVVDEETRSEPRRLWLTVLIDAYSRSVLGFALLYEDPCIESIQQALQNAIWPKPEEEREKLGIEGEWPCCGIPLQLSLDNAWCHHSHSLEELAREISMNGKYNSIDLVFRKPYKARYGALIERFFGTLSARIKERLEGAIQSSHPKDVRNAAKKACLLYQDIYRFILDEIVTYQNTQHSELGMSPNDKWEQGLQSEIPVFPYPSIDVERLFWRLHPEKRQKNQKGISLFGMHYWSPSLSKIPSKNINGKSVKLGIRYDPSDISCLSIFRDGKYVCDVRAKELRLANNEYRSVSLWERELAKELACNDGKATRDWVAYLNEIRDVIDKRKAEKKEAQRRARKSNSKSSPKVDISEMSKAIEQVSASNEEEYDRFIAGFTRHASTG
jgi:transposase InsO family protein